MALQVSMYKAGLQYLTPASWGSLIGIQVILIEKGTGWSFDPDHISLTSLNLGTTETAATGYARESLATGAAIWSAPTWTLPAGAVVWSSLGVDEEIEAVVVASDAGTDADSEPWFVVHDSVPGTAIAVCDGTNMIFDPTLTVT